VKTCTFNHPKIDKDHILNMHVIYELDKNI
jgi:hypothetical protein